MGGQLLEGWLDESAEWLVSVVSDRRWLQRSFKIFGKNFL